MKNLMMFAIFLVTGCLAKHVAPAFSGQDAESRPSLFPEAKEFRWGSGTILLGMTKEAVLEQIKRTWTGPAEDVFARQGMKVPGVKMPSNEQQMTDRWKLSYGEGSGAAPGGGGITFVFEKGSLVKIVIGPAFA